ncbi:MAG: M48 family metallopeptidase [Planctomycetes bacterium]|nr:M48 family metallopeptidase [Planctomycetota bacterium]
MKTTLKSKMLMMCSLMFLIGGCSTIPITGRRQFNLVPDSIINSMSLQSYNDFLSQNQLSQNQQQSAMVLRTGSRIQHAVEQYSTEYGLDLEGYEWEFNLVQDDQVNAWAMPGGKVVVYTGLLPIARDENGLAVVMGHEIAHAIAKHGGERMTQGLLVQMGGMALSEALTNYPVETQQLFTQAYGMGTEIGVLLPYSRKHESEADHLGLIFMAMAGYDLNAAVDFWQRMADLKEGAAPPELLSTHPSDSRRIRDIKALIPEAMKYYREPIDK